MTRLLSNPDRDRLKSIISELPDFSIVTSRITFIEQAGLSEFKKNNPDFYLPNPGLAAGSFILRLENFGYEWNGRENQTHHPLGSLLEFLLDDFSNAINPKNARFISDLIIKHKLIKETYVKDNVGHIAFLKKTHGDPGELIPISLHEGTPPSTESGVLDSKNRSTEDFELKSVTNTTTLLSNAEENIKKNKDTLDEIIRIVFSIDELERFITFYMNTKPQDIRASNAGLEFIQATLAYFERHKKLANVVMGMRQWRPNDQELYSYSMKVGLAAKVIPPEIPNFDLESIIHQETGIRNLMQWRSKLGKIENQVCLIKLKKDENSKSIPNGTGFLIGDNLVLTNWHVVNHFIDTNGKPKAIKSDSISAHFGFFAELDTNQDQAGITYLLDQASWLVAHSPQEELDYALLRLERNAAEAGGLENRPQDSNMAKRGHIAMLDEISVREQMPLFIIQHPGGKPMGIAVDRVSKIENERNRIQYVTNTDRGSSGSPCFDANWNLVALHHAGGLQRLTGEVNQGIPVDKIFASLKSKNIDLS
ncbi:trypsin-like peptidase domain-containing protein [Anabaena cylindrica UHCC 0172]|uniref:trypsin-like peptidase domain-containing protein n=1 Tax=Anabaena cylindrica TaxID=1165 RepID=UPI002B208B16|nr:trypsin-like peptidase domain-containing protein [Anabaena cylindrica]MEA5550885.1 trypsin-like peptidase domain-containing protein [Anabaena cylindrica UHCC 0172]